MANSVTISIAKDFSKFPAGRFESDGPYSGETFRKNHLIPALEKYDVVTVNIDGVEGYGSSFLEEAFGGLIRKHSFNASDLQKRLKIISTDTDYEMFLDEIQSYIKSAKKA